MVKTDVNNKPYPLRKVSEYYKKADVTANHKDPKKEFPDLPEDTIVVKVKRGSKIKNILGFVEKSFKEDSKRHMIFTGCGDALEKTITCVEITKTKFKGLHQLTKIDTFRVEEYWDPTKDDLDRLQVTREIPMIFILLCKDALDSNQPGYQGPQENGRFPKRNHKRKNTDDHHPVDDKTKKEVT